MLTASKRRWVFVVVAIAVVAVVIVVTFLNRPRPDIGELKPEFSMSAAELIDAFAENEAAADARYGGKVLEVQGAVKQMMGDENAPILVMGDTSRDLSISCYLKTGTVQQYAGLERGDVVTVKGICNGMLIDIMLDRVILLTR